MRSLRRWRSAACAAQVRRRLRVAHVSHLGAAKSPVLRRYGQPRSVATALHRPRRRLALVDAARPCRPAAVSDGAQPDRGGVARLISRRGISSRSRPPALQVSPGNEAHLHAFATEAIGPTGRARRSICTPRRNSPARSCWRPARQRIFELARVFRNRERGPLHHPEFTMLEWYRAGEPYEALMEDCAALLRARRRGGRRRRDSRWRGREADPFARAGAADRGRGVRALSPASTCWRRVDADGATDREALAAAARPGSASPADDTWSDMFSRVMVEKVEPQSRPRPRDDPLRISGRRGGAGAAEAARSARGRALRALCLRRRARQRLRRTDRPGRAAPPLRGRDGREGSASTASAIRSTRIFWPRWRRCRRPAASRSASTAW